MPTAAANPSEGQQILVDFAKSIIPGVWYDGYMAAMADAVEDLKRGDIHVEEKSPRTA